MRRRLPWSCGLTVGLSEGGGEAPVARPVERGPGVRLSSWRHLVVAGEVRDRIAPAQRVRESPEHCVLDVRVGQQVGALELDANRKIVAPLAALP
jgi:hypothetical protein